MARAKKEEFEDSGDISGEYKRPDAAGALKIYKNEIASKHAHIATIKGDLSEPYKRIKDECNFPRKILDFLIQLDAMEEAKRDHWLIALSAGLTELDIFMPRDLVSMANGEDGGSVIPIGSRSRSQLATLNPADDDFDDDDDEDADPEDFSDTADLIPDGPGDGLGAAGSEASTH